MAARRDALLPAAPSRGTLPIPLPAANYALGRVGRGREDPGGAGQDRGPGGGTAGSLGGGRASLRLSQHEHVGERQIQQAVSLDSMGSN